MVKMRIPIFLFLFSIFYKCEILDAAKHANTKPKISHVCLTPACKNAASIAAKRANTKPSLSHVCSTPACKNAASVILHYIDPKVAPCDDFYEFVCGKFIKTAVIPETKNQVDRFDFLSDKLQQQLKIIIEEPILPKEPRSFALAKNYYKACMNMNAIEKSGVRTVLTKFKKVGGWPVLEGDSWKEKNFDWTQSTLDIKKLGYGMNYFFALETGGDRANPVLGVGFPNPFSIDRQFLIRGFKNNKVITAYYNYMVDIAVLFGANRAKAEKELKESLEFEIQLATISVSEHGPVNKLTVKELAKEHPIIPWKQYFNTYVKTPLKKIVIGDNDEVVLITPKFLKKLEKLMKNTPKRVQANYLFWKAAQESLDYLTPIIKSRKMKFTSLLNGPAAKQPRWKECVDRLQDQSQQIQLSVGAMYVRKYFDPQSKKLAEELVANIEKHFEKNLKEVDWMDEKTRKTALDKLSAMKFFIGYPDELLDAKILDKYYKSLEITQNDYVQVGLNISIFAAEDLFTMFRRPMDISEWTSHPITAVINAAYWQEHYIAENVIISAAGNLQDIWFGKDKLQCLNYGGIGFLQAQEISRAFDNVGRQNDKKGNPVDWWTPKTEKNFFKKADCIAGQYGNYTDKEVQLKLNGSQTQDANIADNGGVKISYLAYQDWVKQHGPEPKLPGLNYSPSQLFWINAAIQQCTKYTPDMLAYNVQSDNHSPAEFRVLGSFSNRPEFARDFKCRLGSKMNPVKKCSVW